MNHEQLSLQLPRPPNPPYSDVTVDESAGACDIARGVADADTHFYLLDNGYSAGSTGKMIL